MYKTHKAAHHYIIITLYFRYPIHYAAANVHHACVLSLINSGSSVDVQDSQGCTPLHFAAAAASDDNAKYVLFDLLDIEDLTQRVISYEISEMSIWCQNKFHKIPFVI